MIVKLLGLVDILSAVMVALLIFGVKSPLVLILAGYLVVKGVIFFSPASILDMIASLIIFYAYLNPINWVILGLLAIWLLQKGIVSVILT